MSLPLTSERQSGVTAAAIETASRLPLRGRWRRLVHERLSALTEGRLTLVEPQGATTFGRQSKSVPDALIHVHDDRLYRRMIFEGGLGGAESFVEGDWQTEDLTAVLRIFARNLTVPSNLERGLVRIAAAIEKVRHALRRNTRVGSRRNIAAHYDLGNEFYALFLDESMTYSCGVFPYDSASLYEASVEKYDRICRLLALAPSDRVLEIGCGWGGFAIHAASRHGCDVVATTISESQYQLARQRVEDAGVSDRVEIVKRDYRDLTGEFDKLASIEMIEAVGHTYQADYLKVVSACLKPHGVAAIQTITIPDQYYETYRNSVDFIQKHLFPGGCLVSLARLTQLMARKTDLTLCHVESMPDHYAKTLRLWRERFIGRLDDVRSLGFDERFIRTWLFYLCYCEAGFAERAIGVSQLLFAKPGARVNLVATGA